MSLTTTPHLNFRGDARAALSFYHSVFGGEIAVTTYGDFGMPAEASGSDKVVFGQVVTADGFRVLAYDIPGKCDGTAESAGTTHRENNLTITTQPFFVAVDGDTFDEVKGYWDLLSAGGTIVEPFAVSAWSAGFGMVTDTFGVTWVLGVTASHAAE